MEKNSRNSVIHNDKFLADEWSVGQKLSVDRSLRMERPKEPARTEYTVADFSYNAI